MSTLTHLRSKLPIVPRCTSSWPGKSPDSDRPHHAADLAYRIAAITTTLFVFATLL